VILDADGLSKLARRDRVVRAMIEQEVRDADSILIVPVIVATQALTHANLNAVREVLAAAHEVVPVDLDRAQEASALMSATGLFDPVDALVAVEALRRVPSIVITSDPGDLRTLLDTDERGRRVAVWRV
jgi:hypothetical protein